MDSLFDIIKRDAKFIVNAGGYDIDIQITNKDGSKTANIRGWAVKVSHAFDTDGNQVSTKHAHITIDEDALTKVGYIVRSNRKNGIEEVDLKDHKVSFKDSSSILKNYIVNQTVPDENLGLITLWLSDYKPY